MHVRKFQADSLEEALKEIKRELGPDAVILKTVTNKGLKGAFKKKKIEITAAISERSYVKKAHVDKVMTPEQKDQFYNTDASHVSNMINDHAASRETAQRSMGAVPTGYGNMGLNKVVNTVKTQNPAPADTSVKKGLDDFLSGVAEKSSPAPQRVEETPVAAPVTHAEPSLDSFVSAADMAVETEQVRETISSTEVEQQQNKIDELEKKLFELSKVMDSFSKKEATGIYHLRTTLRSLDISEVFVNKLIRKALFELSEEEIEDLDTVFEFALQEMMKEIQVGMPLFSATSEGDGSVVTVLLSETSCGQSSMLMKLGTLREDSVLIRYVANDDEQVKSFTQKMFGLEVIIANSVSEIVTECRKAVENGKAVFVDYKSEETTASETKKFIDGLRRSFDKVEVLISLSAIHSEMYNRKVVSSYRAMADGLVVSHLDLCLNFGSLFNISEDTKELPYKFYGTGRMVPDDLEAATAERILAGVFQFK